MKIIKEYNYDVAVIGGGVAGCAVAVLWSLMAAVILGLLMLYGESVDWISKPTLLLSRPILLAIGLVTVLALLAIGCWKKKGICALAERLGGWPILVFSVALFAAQAYIFYQSYFLTGWDSGEIVRTAQSWAYGLPIKNEWYFAEYPNNIFLTSIYKWIFSANAAIGNPANDVYVVILLNSLLSCLTGGLLFSVLRRQMGTVYGYLGWLVFVAHVALSPWIFILYSDSFVLIVPLLILWMYQRAQEAKHPWLWWLGIGAAAYLGFKIKPQVILVPVALVVVEVLEWIRQKGRKPLLALGKRLVAALAAMAVCLGLYVGLIEPAFLYELDPDQEIGFTHFIMMGLNSESNGTYSGEDVELSEAARDQEERKRENLRVIGERLEQMGVGGLARHLACKTLVNYGDGSYAWMQEGGFFLETYEDKHSTPAMIFKNFYYGNDKEVFVTLENGIWLVLLLGCVGVAFFFLRRAQTSPVLLAAVTSLIGLTLFELLFEARARYLFIYSPFYILVGLLGWREWGRMIQGIRKKEKKNGVQ